MNREVAMILAGTHPNWMLDLLLLNKEGLYWAKIRSRVGHAFSSGRGQTPMAAVVEAFSSVDLGIQAS